MSLDTKRHLQLSKIQIRSKKIKHKSQKSVMSCAHVGRAKRILSADHFFAQSRNSRKCRSSLDKMQIRTNKEESRKS